MCLHIASTITLLLRETLCRQIINAHEPLLPDAVHWQVTEATSRHCLPHAFHRQIIASHDRVSAYHPREVAQAFLDGELEEFDFAASYSSIEHSGLGRYGDPLNPQVSLYAC